MLATAAGGCGTILHPERRGQPAGPLDWKIVALDTIGLLLFFIPGVIAFAVDFSNGTIYLPPKTQARRAASEPGAEKLAAISIPREQLTQEGIAAAVSEHAGREVCLQEGLYTTHPLPSIQGFWPLQRRLTARS